MASKYDPAPASAATDCHPGKALVQGPDCTPVTTERILGYIAANYSGDKFRQLVTVLGEHTSLDTLIPALFGVSCLDFEAAWQSYLAQRY